MLILRAVVVGAAASILLALFLLATAYARADEPQPQPFNIGPQSLAAALGEFARQSHEELLFAPEVVAKKSSPGVRGTMLPQAALQILLRDSGLSFSTTPSGAVLVGALRSASPLSQPNSLAPPTSDEQKEGKSNSSQDFRLAQAIPGQTPSPSTVEKPEASSEKRKEQLQEVIVIGSRIPLATHEGPQPVQTYTQEQIGASGQTTVADFLNQLPDVSISSSEFLGVGYFPGQTTVQVHGLPVGTTLVLLNGRRLESNIEGFFDLSSIPVSAVERIEILPVGASAIYGADALGGAVNIVLRSEMDGFEANAKHAHSDGMDDTDLNGGWGRSWSRGSVSLLATYQDRGDLFASDRQVTSTLAAPGPQPSPFVYDECSPGNVYSLSGGNLPGLSSPEAGIPAGITGRPTLGEFAATAGRLNLCNLFATTDLVPQVQRVGLLLNGHLELAEAVELFTETIFTHQDVSFKVSPLVSGYGGSFGYTTLGASNPYNPFGETVGVSFADDDLLDQTRNSENFFRPLIGLRGVLHSDWHYEITAWVSRDRLTATSSNPDQTALQNALDSSSAATALNPFLTQAPTGMLLQSLLQAPNDDQFTNQMSAGQAIVRGPIAQLPAGALQAVLGVEYGHENLVQDEQGDGQAPFLVSLDRTTYAGFAEVRVPLLSGATRAAGDERLALTLAGRYDHSSDYGGKATWQSGLQWRPVDALLVRGGYSESYQAPLLSQISAGQLFSETGEFEVVDPFRGNQPYNGLFSFGANANLKPETGSARDLGVVYSGAQGLGASVTWYDIRILNYIFAPGFQTLVDYPQYFPGAVVRAPPTPQDVAAGYLGQILAINDTYYNFGSLRVSGVDPSVKYTFGTRLGELTPSVAAAYIYRWLSSVTPGAPAVSYLSQATEVGPGFAPRWKGTGAIGWRLGSWSANLDARFVSRYRDYQDIVVNSNELGDFWIFDLNARWDVGQHGSGTAAKSSGMYIAAGVTDLFARQPQLSYAYPWDPAEFDIRGRTVYAQVGITWR
jgi:iron complex outermembrane recepter protein